MVSFAIEQICPLLTRNWVVLPGGFVSVSLVSSDSDSCGDSVDFWEHRKITFNEHAPQAPHFSVFSFQFSVIKSNAF